MAIRCFLLGGVQLEDGIRDQHDYWKRKNLMDCPEVLQYRSENCASVAGGVTDISFYINTMGSCIILMDYALFDSEYAMWEDYQNSGPIYKRCYREMVHCTNRMFRTSKMELDWVMPVKAGLFQISNKCVTLEKELRNENDQYVALIDCAMIYQSVMHISTFFKSLTLMDTLDHFQQYQISFYSQTLNLIREPVFFLLNTNDIEIYKEFYKAWDIAVQIEIAEKIADKAISMFSFLSDYKEKNKESLIGYMLPYLSFLLSYESVMELMTWLLPMYAQWIDTGMRLILLTGTCIVITFICRMYVRRWKQNCYFRSMTINTEKDTQKDR